MFNCLQLFNSGLCPSLEQNECPVVTKGLHVSVPLEGLISFNQSPTITWQITFDYQFLKQSNLNLNIIQGNLNIIFHAYFHNVYYLCVFFHWKEKDTFKIVKPFVVLFETVYFAKLSSPYVKMCYSLQDWVHLIFFLNFAV